MTSASPAWPARPSRPATPWPATPTTAPVSPSSSSGTAPGRAPCSLPADRPRRAACPLPVFAFRPSSHCPLGGEPRRHARPQAQPADRQELGRAWQDNGLIFTTKTGRPVEPRNLVRSFHRICDTYKLRDIKVHHLRHTTATLLKNLGVP